MKQCDLTKGLVVFLTIMITILFCGLMPGAWAYDVSDCDDCKKMDIEGCYVFSDNGKLIMPNPDPASPILITASMACVGIVHLENGNITGIETTSLGPDFPHVPGGIPGTITGSYVVYPNCTGIATMCIVNPDGDGIESTISFVIIEKGKEIQMVTTDMAPCGETPSNAYFRPINIVGTLKGCDG
jgi:hypothetical protein